MVNIVFTLCLPRDEASVPVVRHTCRDSMLMLGIGKTCVGEIELAVTEACTNVLKHVAESDAEYEVSVEIGESTCHIRVIDRGPAGFDHAALGITEAHPDAESGRGIFLMRAMVDELHFEVEPQVGSVVHLVKRLDLEEDSVLQKLALSK